MGERDGVFLGIGWSALVAPGGRGLEPKEAGRRHDGNVGQYRIWNPESDKLNDPPVIFLP